MKRTLHRLLTGAVVALVLAVVGIAVHGQAANSQRPRLAAYASSIAIVVDVNIRATPDTSQAPLTLMPAGSTPTYICYVDGEDEQGTTKWFYVTWNGVTGYYSSIADDVPLALQNNIEGNYGIPRCGTGTDINQGSASDILLDPAPTVYNRAAAATWALQNAQAVRADRSPTAHGW